jgi:succinoglycan biosynthesis transport protein ExoP
VGTEGGLPELVDAIRWRWPAALLIALAVFAGTYFYVASRPSKYDGKAVVAISPRPNVPNAGSDTVRVEAPKYVAYVNAPEQQTLVRQKLGLPFGAIDGAVDGSIQADTGNLTITARLEDPVLAARVANEYANRVVAFSASDPLLTAQTVARAVPPTAVAYPPRHLFWVAGAVIGLLLGTAASIVLERLRPRLRSWRAMATLTGYPVVGRVPRTRALRSRPLEAFSDPATGSAFRTLRANLEPQLRAEGIDVLLVTSPNKGDGKTTVAALLAESLSRLGNRVLLIDADLKRPRVARLAHLDGRPGLVAVLRDGRSIEDEVTQGWIDELDVLPTIADPEGSDLLARRFADVVQHARARYDLVVIDAPPLLGTDDARTVAPLAAGVLLVVSSGSHAEPVNEAVLVIESLKAPLLGIIANRLKEARRSYY